MRRKDLDRITAQDNRLLLKKQITIQTHKINLHKINTPIINRQEHKHIHTSHTHTWHTQQTHSLMHIYIYR